jgi:hypothetical protein
VETDVLDELLVCVVDVELSVLWVTDDVVTVLELDVLVSLIVVIVSVSVPVPVPVPVVIVAVDLVAVLPVLDVRVVLVVGTVAVMDEAVVVESVSVVMETVETVVLDELVVCVWDDMVSVLVLLFIGATMRHSATRR